VYAGVFLLSLLAPCSSYLSTPRQCQGTVVPAQPRGGDGSGCRRLDQGAGGGFPLASGGLELFLRENCLERDAKSSNGSRFPKAQRGFGFPVASWQSVARGNAPSDGGVERYVRGWRRTHGGRSPLGSDRAANCTDQTLSQVVPTARPGCGAAGREPGLGGTHSAAARRAGLVATPPGWSSSRRGDAPQGPRGCSVELAHSFPSPSPCVADGAPFFQTLLSFFSFGFFLSAHPY